MPPVPGPLLVEVSTTVAEVTAQADVVPSALLDSVGYPPGRLNLHQAPSALWHQACSGLNAGISAQAGEGATALVALLLALSAHVPGNARVLALAKKLGGSLTPNPGARGAIFLSYATINRPDVNQVYDAILRADPGAVVFQDHRSIKPGQRWADVIRDQAGDCAVMACWLTSAWLTSVYTQYEVGVAEARGGVIVPIEAEPGILGKVPAFLAAPQSVRLPHDFDSVAAALLAARP